MRREVLALFCALGMAGCQSCNADEAAKPGPPMPTGMLVPLEAAASDSPPLAAARGVPGPSGV